MYANLYLKQFLIKLPLKKKPNYSDYKFSIKYPIDYRYLSFNHLTTLKVIFKIIQKKDKVVIKFKIISLDLSKAFKLCSLTEYMNKSKYLKSLEIGD